mmetsp:Transcript_80149/g.259670  ORF Transcript_80149/g.259670 Transcript_80149/m.259670 type:complete len:593 (+) Transcript_80149:136-1914(+)
MLNCAPDDDEDSVVDLDDMDECLNNDTSVRDILTAEAPSHSSKPAPPQSEGDIATPSLSTGALAIGNTSCRRPSLTTFQLHRPSCPRMFICSVVGFVHIFLGLLLLGLGSRLQHNIGNLCSRILAWAIVFQYPFYFTSGSNVRNLIMYGMQPEGIGEIFVYGTWTYQRFFELTKSSVKAYQLLFFKLVAFFVSSTLHCIYLGEKYQFPGYLLVYTAVLISHMALTNTVIPKLWQPIDAEFHRKSGPPTMGAAMVGFFVLTVGFGLAKRHLGLWAGAILPLVLSAYENIGCRIAGQFFLKQFVEKGLHKKFGMTLEILPSLTITYLHCMSQGARLCILVARAAWDPDDHWWMFTLGFGLVFNVSSRTLWIGRCIQLLSGGYWRMDNFQRLLAQAKFQGGYPPFLALFGVGAVRAALGHPWVPNSTVAIVTVGLVVVNILEDILVLALGYFNVLPVFQTDEPDAEALRASSHAEFGADLDQVVPVHSTAARLSEAMDLQLLAWDLQYNLRVDFPELPLWAHVPAVMFSQFNTVMCLIIFGGGINFVLGFCNASAEASCGGHRWRWYIHVVAKLSEGAGFLQHGATFAQASGFFN